MAGSGVLFLWANIRLSNNDHLMKYSSVFKQLFMLPFLSLIQFGMFMQNVIYMSEHVHLKGKCDRFLIRYYNI